MAHPGESFLHNKKIYNVLKEAVDSPIGSTKRKAAKNLVNIMNRAMSKYDAQGGPGYGYYGQGGPGHARYSPTTPGSASFATKAPRKDPDYSNMIIFPSPPAAHRGHPMTNAMAQSAQQAKQAQTPQSGMSGIDPTQQSAPQAQQPMVAASNFNQVQSPPDILGAFSNVTGPTNPAQQSQSQTQQSISNALTGLGAAGAGSAGAGKGGPGDLNSPDSSSPWTPPTSFTSVATPQLNQPNFSPSIGQAPSTPPPANPYSSLTGVPSSLTSQYPSLGGSSLMSQYPSLSSASGLGLYASIPTFGQQTTTSAAPTTSTTPATSGSPSSTVGLPGSTTEAPTTSTTGSSPDGSSTGSTGSTGLTGSTTGSTGSTGPSSTQNLQNSISNAVNGNLGATGWAEQTMGNKALMQEIFPGATGLPTSASLTDAVTQLSDSLKQQYNIKGLQDQLLQMTANGVTLGPMLQTYIQNKDQSLNAIHSQILNAQDQMLKLDQGNPYEMAIWSRYGDYLNNIYTAQNASYADFFNKSTTMYSNALNALDKTLTNSLAQYNNDLTIKATAMEADYATTKQALTDMYTAAQQAPLQEIQLATLKSQLALANAQLVGAGTGQGQGDWTAEYKKLVDAGILFSNVKPTTSKSGNVGELLPGTNDLTQAVNTILSDNPKIGLDGAIYIMGNAMQKSLAASGSNPDTSLKNAAQYTAMVETAVNQPNPVISASQALSLLSQIGTTVGKSVYSSLYNQAAGKDNTATAKQALVDAFVGSKGWLGLGAASVPTAAQFAQKYGSALSPTLANELYTAIDTQKSLIQNLYKTNPQQYAQQFGQMTPDQVNKGWADEVNSLTSPAAIADYTGQKIAALFGVTNADLTGAMNPDSNAMLDPNTLPTSGSDTFSGNTP